MPSEKQKRFIEEELRWKKYGINKDGNQVDNPLASDLQQSVIHLSEGLNGNDIHFILELIQNAEDNYYKKRSPDLKFLLLDHDPTGTVDSDGCLCVFNNEIGFRKKHIRAICAVGHSTKSKKLGYIGEKGIGFKSVFKISYSPHIYSNGYRIKFLGKDPNLNLSHIVPYWLDTIPEVVQSHHEDTTILLPLKKEKRQEIIEELRKIKPETILFLSKLENIALLSELWNRHRRTTPALHATRPWPRRGISTTCIGALYNYLLLRKYWG